MTQVPLLAPQAGQDLVTVKVVEWRKAPGDAVKRDEVVLVIESEKATIDVEAPCDGILGPQLVATGQDAQVLQPVAMILTPEVASAAQPAPASAPAPAGPAQSAAPVPAPLHAAVPAGGRVHASPLARRMAQKHGIDLTRLRGSGPGGRIKARDLPAAGALAAQLSAGPAPAAGPAPGAAPASAPRSAAASAPLPPAAGDQVQPFDTMRRVIAERLTRSWTTIPHFHLDRTIDLGAALARKAELASRRIKVTITDLVLHALVAALRQHPRCNAHVEADRLVVKAQVNVGLAVAVPGGLLVPVIPGAEGMDLQEIARQTRLAADEAKAGRYRPRAPGTCTVTTLGALGVERFAPIINPPEAIILAIGALRQEVVVVDGLIGIRPRCTLTLAADHRAIDGAEAAALLATLDARLQAG